MNSNYVIGRQGYGVVYLYDGVDLHKFVKNLVRGNSWGYNPVNLIRSGCEELKIMGLALNGRPSAKRLPISDTDS